MTFNLVTSNTESDIESLDIFTSLVAVLIRVGGLWNMDNVDVKYEVIDPY